MNTQPLGPIDPGLTARVRAEINERRLALLASAIREHEQRSTRAGGPRTQDGYLYRRLREFGPAEVTA